MIEVVIDVTLMNLMRGFLFWNSQIPPLSLSSSLPLPQSPSLPVLQPRYLFFSFWQISK